MTLRPSLPHFCAAAVASKSTRPLSVEVSLENEFPVGPVCLDDESKLPSIIWCQGNQKRETKQSGG
eukprot:bmy_20399T0